MKIISKTINYFKDVKSEIKKVSWPSKERTIKDSAMVVAVSLATAAFLGGIDYVFYTLIQNYILTK